MIASSASARVSSSFSRYSFACSSEVGRDLLDRVVLTLLGLAAPGQRPHADQIDDADVVALEPDRDLQHQRRGVEARHHHVDTAEEVRTGAVELVDEAHTRDVVLVGLAPDVLGLRLHAGDTVVDRDGAVEHAQRPLHLDREVDVTGRVDDLDRVALPLTLGGGGGDGDATLLLLLHPVHDGSALVDFTDLVRDTGVEQDPLGRGRLTGVDVRHDADVADLGERGVCGGHVSDPYFVSSRRSSVRLPAVVREGLVGLGHLVRVLAPLDRGTETVAGVEQLVLRRSIMVFSRRACEYVTSQRRPSVVCPRRPHLDRHLVGRATDAAAANLEGRLDVVHRALQRHHRVGAGLLAAALERAVDDALGKLPLALSRILLMS